MSYVNSFCCWHHLVALIHTSHYQNQTKTKSTNKDTWFMIESFKLDPQDFSSNSLLQTGRYVTTDNMIEEIIL